MALKFGFPDFHPTLTPTRESAASGACHKLPGGAACKICTLLTGSHLRQVVFAYATPGKTFAFRQLGPPKSEAKLWLNRCV